jgi:hypothetical protein
MRMVFMIVILLGTVFSRGACADPVMQVQLPFYDGKAYRCTQNSDDTPTHQMASTKYDLDFNMKIGDIVVSAADGVMRHGRDSDGFGTYAKVDHGNGHWTMYGHLGGYIAHDGDVVVAGQPIAYSGNTGKVYPVPTRDNPSGGQHLHFGVHDGAGTGVSQSMEVHAFDQSSGNLDWFATGTATESEFVCDESSAVRNGHTYESRPIGQIFSDYQCRELTDGGVLCWSGNPTTCEDGQGHVWYRKDNEGANVSNLWQKCLQVSGNEVSIFSYLEGGYGIGGPGPGTWTDAADDPIPNLPDFIVRKLWLETPWGFETYQYGSPEIMKMKAQFENIGDGNLPSGSAPIEVHFYLSKGYKEDPHSGDGAWKRVGTDYIQPENLRTGDTHTETEGIELWRDIPSPGIWNIVACIDHPQDDHNDGGDHPEKHESNNCSTEAVFEVTADGQVVNVASVDFVTSSLQFLQTPRYAGDQARFGAYVTNQGTAGPPAGIRSSYAVECPGTGRILLADDGTEASELSPGSSAWEETLSPVTLPNVSGACTATFCADYQGAVSETDEGNNCTSLSFTLEPRPAPKLVITKFEDEKGCCTSSTGSRIEPDIWVRNDGPVAPATNVTVIYHIASPVATGGAWWHIGSGIIEPRELPPGGTDEDYMDGNGWPIPNSSAWKKQWHTIRGCLKADGSMPVGDPSTEVCAYYTRYSKK